MTTEAREFTLTADHVKLLRHAYVRWNDAETGAPEIDPKRPYGNSDVASDVAGMVDTPLSTAGALELHRQTETALQIVLETGSFEPGIYRLDNPWGGSWKLITREEADAIAIAEAQKARDQLEAEAAAAEALAKSKRQEAAKIQRDLEKADLARTRELRRRQRAKAPVRPMAQISRSDEGRGHDCNYA